MLEFWLCFVPLFVAIDGIAVLPIFIGFTNDLENAKVRQIIWQSLITALVVSLVFVLVGAWLLNLLGITVSDFMIAGGALLFIIAMNQLVRMDEKNGKIQDTESFGAVPLGVPLIVGPGVLATSLLLSNQYGYWLTAISLVVNIILVGIMFWFSRPIFRFLGKSGAKAFSKIASLLLAAIAVMIIRKGIMQLIGYLR